MSNVHYLEPERETLHGPFDQDLTPCVTIDSGDTVRLRTLDSGWGVEKRSKLGAPRKKFPGFDRDRDSGHALIGPIEIRGAEPRMSLEIRINEIIPGSWGWASVDGFKSYWNDRMGVAEGPERVLDFELDADSTIGRSQFGDFSHTVTLKPFMGVMGMPPDAQGKHPTFPPRYCGGNLDCKELVAGSILYLPISVKGAKFSVGDGHAAQGDGEVAGPALECPMERVDLTLTVRDNMKLKMPRAKTPAGWITMGLHEGLDEAVLIALDGMLELMCELYTIPRKEAYALASLVVDIRVPQIVNLVKGVHAVLPYGAVK